MKKYLILLLFSFPAFGAEIHQCPNGDDNNPGTEAEPVRTIERGIELLSPGDALMVCEGEPAPPPIEVPVDGCGSVDMVRRTYFVVYDSAGQPVSTHSSDHVAKESATNRAIQNPGETYFITGANYEVSCD